MSELKSDFSKINVKCKFGNGDLDETLNDISSIIMKKHNQMKKIKTMIQEKKQRCVLNIQIVI